jgi:CubicO group peptidase (beta-lactamase class C family)
MTGRLVDKGLLDPKSKVEKYLKDFKGTAIGSASVQQALDMTSGLPTLLDFHTPGAPGYIFEIEEGMKPGKPMGHRKAIKSTDAVAKPGEAWNYSDKNTDTLALLAESVTVSKRVFSLSSG